VHGYGGMTAYVKYLMWEAEFKAAGVIFTVGGGTPAGRARLYSWCGPLLCIPHSPLRVRESPGSSGRWGFSFGPQEGVCVSMSRDKPPKRACGLSWYRPSVGLWGAPRLRSQL